MKSISGHMYIWSHIQRVVGLATFYSCHVGPRTPPMITSVSTQQPNRNSPLKGTTDKWHQIQPGEEKTLRLKILNLLGFIDGASFVSGSRLFVSGMCLMFLMKIHTNCYCNKTLWFHERDGRESKHVIFQTSPNNTRETIPSTSKIKWQTISIRVRIF